MAERRMFAKTIIDSDAFLDMPCSTQCLYFHLSMRADDDGFVNGPKKIQRTIGASDDDLKLLIAKRFLIPFESGVVVIKHWKIHNYIQADRYKPTVYQEEKAMLSVKQNKAYSLSDEPKTPEFQTNEPMYPECIQNVSEVDTQVRLGKSSIVKSSIDQDKIGEGSGGKENPTPNLLSVGLYGNVLLTRSDLERLQKMSPYADAIINRLSVQIFNGKVDRTDHAKMVEEYLTKSKLGGSL